VIIETEKRRFGRKRIYALIGITLVCVASGVIYQVRRHHRAHARRIASVEMTAGYDDGLTISKQSSSPAQKSQQLVFIGLPQGAKLPEEILKEVTNRTGAIGRRAREIKIDTDLLLSQSSEERNLRLELFPDTTVTAILYPTSQLEVNEAFVSGAIQNDPKGQITLAISKGTVSGTIVTSKARYRIMTSGHGTHYLVDLEKK
jgi:hypothetical protein